MADECRRVVGLGASAGGLEPLSEYLRACARGQGLAHVVVQHLAQGHTSALPALLQQHCDIPVLQARLGAVLAPDVVHVIPPGSRLTVADGRLLLSPIGSGALAGARVIDDLFKSLADAFGALAVGVVFSGMGSDGTEGLRAIVGRGGQGWVQWPDAAQFDSMPRHALAIGRGVQAASPGSLPGRIAGRLMPPPREPALLPALSADQARTLAAVLHRVRLSSGHDFTGYKLSTLRRRIERRMSLHAAASMADYLRLLTDNPQEAMLLFKELLIGVTSFFRDPAAWQALRDHALPGLLAAAAARPARQFRAWVTACSTGEEAYTLAMLLHEQIDSTPALHGLTPQIFATDLSEDAIQVARRGLYPASVAADLTAERLDRCFVPEGENLRVCKRLRESVLFARHDMLTDAPFSRLDLVCCRNLLIYFNSTLQQRLLPLFHYVLQPDGVLMLGSAETVGRFEALLEPMDPKQRLYRRAKRLQTTRTHAEKTLVFPTRPPHPHTAMTDPMNDPLNDAMNDGINHATNDATPPPPALAPPGTGPAGAPLQLLADRLMLDEFSPPAVLVNADGDILYINGRTGKYLEPAAGKANWNLHVMTRSGLRAGLEAALVQMQQTGQAADMPGLVVDTGAGPVTVDVSVRPVTLARHGPLVLVVFREPATARRRRPRPGAKGDELQRLVEDTQALREEMTSSQEELQSTNEELQSTNEELQSANEELTTSKEEMQAMNEELQTVNAELMCKLDDLALAQSDLKNLLNSTQIATLFLDGRKNVRRFTERASKVIKLREGDIGRPLTDLTTTLDYPDLQADIDQVLHTLEFSEKVVRTTDGRWYSVRVMPYRTLDNVIDGSVITFVDVTVAKQLEARLRAAPAGPAEPISPAT